MLDDTTAPQPSGVLVAPGVYVPDAALRFSFTRSSGPGGQNVNKLATKARLHVPVEALRAALPADALERLLAQAGAARLNAAGELVIADESTRSQQANREACVQRLRELVVTALKKPKIRRPTKPTAGSRRRRRAAKELRARVKEQRRPPEVS